MVEEVCSVCFSPSVTTENGVLVCTVCGTQSQAYAEEEQEYEGALQSSRYRRTVRFKAPKRVAVELEEAPTEDSQAKAYCLCLQETLLVLSQHLQEELGVDSAVTTVARRIWFAKLAQSGVLEPGASFSSLPKAEADEAEGRDAASPSDAAKASLLMLSQRLHKVLYPDIVLSILLLSAVVLKAPVTPVDLIGQTLSGELPFFKEIYAACNRLDPKGTLRLVNLIHRPGVMGSWLLLRDAATIAMDLQLRLPPLNAEALLQRFCFDLALPLEASAGMRVVLDCYEAGGLRLCLTPDIYQNPYLHLMAMLVVVVKAQYQDHPRELRHFDWQQWSQTVLHNTSSRHPPGLQGDDAGVRDVEATRKTLLSSVFGGSKVPDEYREHHQILGEICAYWQKAASQDSSRAGDLPERASSAEDQRQLDFAEGSISAEKQRQLNYAYLITAAASYIWVQPGFLHKVVDHLQTDLLSMERIATKLFVSG